MADLITCLLGWLDDHPWVLDAVLTFTVVVATQASVRLTRALVRTETEPDVAVYIDVDRPTGLFQMVIHNVGRGPAYDVRLAAEPDIRLGGLGLPDDMRSLTGLPLFTRGLPYMAPGQEVRFILGVYRDLAPYPSTVTVSYRGKESLPGWFVVLFTKKPPPRLDVPYPVDVGLFYGLDMGDPPPEREVARAIDELAAIHHGFRHGDARLWVNVLPWKARRLVEADDGGSERWPPYRHERLWRHLKHRVRRPVGRGRGRDEATGEKRA